MKPVLKAAVIILLINLSLTANSQQIKNFNAESAQAYLLMKGITAPESCNNSMDDDGDGLV